MVTAFYPPATRFEVRAAIPWAVAVAGAGVVTGVLLPLREHVPLVVVALTYLLFVVVVSASWGLWPGIVATLSANVLLDLFFIPPLYGLALYKLEDLLGLSAFLVAAASIGTILSSVRRREAAAVRSRDESALLYELSTLIISDISSGNALEDICKTVCAVFRAESCSVFALDGRQALATASGRASPEPTLHGGDIELSLTVGTETVGTLKVVRPHVRTTDGTAWRSLRAFAQVAALALHHGALMRRETETLALKEADELKSALLAAVSHQLRTPLGSIKTAATSLLTEGPQWSAAERAELLTVIDGATDRLTKLVTDILDLSRIEGGALRPVCDWYDVGELLADAVSGLDPSLRGREVCISVGEAVGEAWGDCLLLGQAVSNLVDNARKFSREGSPIRVGAERRSGTLEISVANLGNPVARADRERVFERFYRGVGVASGVPGSGLGLTIARGLVEAHGGAVRLEELPGGQGTLALIVLPAERAAGVA